MPDEGQEVGDEVDRRGEVGDEERQRELRPPRYARVAKQWPTRTGTRAHVALSGSSGSTRIFRVSARSFDSSSDSSPSSSQSMTTSPSAGACARSCSIRSTPAPEADW